jgi:hypothetical protein
MFESIHPSKMGDISEGVAEYKSAACLKFDMVWLYRSPISVGTSGVLSSFI